MILAIICAGLLAGVVYTVTKGKSGTQKKQEASAEAGRNGITVRNHRRRRKEIQTDIKTEAKLKEVLGSDFNANMTVADIKEVTAPEGAKFPLKITFAMKGVTASSKVQILHYDAEKAAWEKIDTTVADGTVTGTFSSLSPVTSATAVSAVAVLGLAAVAAFGLKKKVVR